MDKVVEYENKVFEEFEELFTDLLESLDNNINNKCHVVERIKTINEQIKEVNDSINNLLIDIHRSLDNDNISNKEIDRRKEDENMKKVYTAFYPQMFLYNLLLNENVNSEEFEPLLDDNETTELDADDTD